MPTLQDLMATIQGGQGATPGQGNLLAALAPLMGGSGGTGTGPLPGGVDLQIQQQIAALSQPEPTVDQPVPAQSKLWQRLIAGIADAGSVYARGLNPYVPTTNALGYLLGQDQAGKDITAQNVQRKKEAAYKGSQRGAEMKLRQLLNEKSGEQVAADKVEAAKLRADDAAARAAEREQARADRLAEAAADNEYRAKEFEWRQKVDKSLMDARARDSRPDRNVKSIAKASTVALVLRDGAPASGNEPAIPGVAERIKAGESPMAILQQFEEELDQEGMSGADREEALNYFKSKVVPVIEKAMQETAPVSAAPMTPTAGEFIATQAASGVGGELKRAAGWLSRKIGPGK